MTNAIELLINKIEKAFSCDDMTVPPDRVAASGLGEEYQIVKQKFGGLNRAQFKAEDYPQYYFALRFFSLIGYRYWLPGFMVASLKDKTNSNLYEFTVYSLEINDDFLEKRIGLFSGDQIEVILQYLQLGLEDNNFYLSLSHEIVKDWKYWAQLLSE
jgi:hypothetical protein